MGGNCMSDVILKATYETLYMVIGSTFFAVILGFIPAIILTLTAPDGLKPNKVIYTILDILVNIFRSFPFVILMVIVIPLTRLIAGNLPAPSGRYKMCRRGAPPQNPAR